MPPSLSTSQNPVHSSVIGTLPATEEHVFEARLEQNHHKQNNPYKQDRKRSKGKTHQEIENGQKSSTTPFPKCLRALQMLKEFLAERFLSNGKEINILIPIPIYGKVGTGILNEPTYQPQYQETCSSPPMLSIHNTFHLPSTSKTCVSSLIVSTQLFGSINHQAHSSMGLGLPSCWDPPFAFRNGPDPLAVRNPESNPSQEI